jgi:hypothetical protein
MPELTETIEDAVEQGRSWLQSIDPKIAAGAVVIALCAGIWVGFKVAGGTVADVAPGPCGDCQKRAAEAAILDDDRPHF